MKKNILFINGHLDAGGCERSLVDVLNSIDYGKYKVDLLLLDHQGDYIEEVPKNVNIICNSIHNAFGPLFTSMWNAIKEKNWFLLYFRLYYLFSTKINVFFFKKVKKLFVEIDKEYDVIIAYRPGICTELAAFAFDGKKKISWWHHGCMNYEGKSAASLLLAYKRMDTIVAVSKNTARLLSETFPEVKQKIKIIPNMIITERLKEKIICKEIGLFDSSVFKIVSVGRLSSEKNMILCPKIATHLNKMGINYIWLLIGDGEEEQCIQLFIDEHHLQKNVIMLGKKTNPYPYIANADVLVHPSLVESQGITLLESMFLETPVIAVNSTGPREFIVNGKNGFLTNNNAEEIADLIKKFYKNDKFGLKIKEKAKKDVFKFDASEIMKKIYKIIEE